MKRLIAILDNPTADPPGHTIKEARAPYCPVASVCVFPEASPRIKEERRQQALAMAASSDMLIVLRDVAGQDPFSCGPESTVAENQIVALVNGWIKGARAAVAKAEGRK